ncbi:MAG: hypothetical protein A3K19_19440 [Lentisphaerae bacterium RIFOXYB12_FULL_65_16]|nr:MAG: hypothetical protein A3K18_31375 [Lentisphaerae bacterium RIFOXYA12_64_32]OGV92036.1 MAG: hypothetical protein A3K19_19440 [Lentisphaerae bacterium RIFOXYB12_FULL_65_16]
MTVSASEVPPAAYPWNVVDEEALRRVFRHRVLNAVAGLSLMVDAIRERGATTRPALRAPCDGMERELAAMAQLAEGSRQTANATPARAAKELSTGVLRDACERFCAELDGVRRQLDTARRGGVDSWFVERCDLMAIELAGLVRFTARLDLLFGPLPAPEPVRVADLLANAAEFFAHRFPLCPFMLNGDPDRDGVMSAGNLYWLALQELLANGGEAAGRHGAVQLFWKTDGGQTLAVINSGEPWASAVPSAPVRPFCSSRGRHDGLGLAIAQRACEALKVELRIRPNLPDAVVVMMVAAS